MPIYGKCKTCGRETISYLCPVCLLNERDQLKAEVEKLQEQVQHACDREAKLRRMVELKEVPQENHAEDSSTCLICVEYDQLRAELEIGNG